MPFAPTARTDTERAGAVRHILYEQELADCKERIERITHGSRVRNIPPVGTFAEYPHFVTVPARILRSVYYISFAYLRVKHFRL